ncbi:MAG: hypothetical protein PHX60_12675 [Giesbergeria sp.]|uniref:putative PDDEXK endonuclease n=1 Tax=Giesbergeria sp. TaxID=2818473 RepID=UPI00262DD08D|nr:hypothetical protein [Giesbergeria sp.]MDD2610516.1 hypothetical protein [Giesbergeria sp.]
MAGMSRTKGKVGERELARLLSELTGYTVARRVRNLAGEDDLQGLPGWSIECKRYAAITPALVAGWWAQAQRQAQAVGQEPVLFYRADKGAWRAVWDASLLLPSGQMLLPTDGRPMLPAGATVEACPVTWWALVACSRLER